MKNYFKNTFKRILKILFLVYWLLCIECLLIAVLSLLLEPILYILSGKFLIWNYVVIPLEAYIERIEPEWL
jgi:hypothetical protein